MFLYMPYINTCIPQQTVLSGGISRLSHIKLYLSSITLKIEGIELVRWHIKKYIYKNKSKAKTKTNKQKERKTEDTMTWFKNNRK